MPSQLPLPFNREHIRPGDRVCIALSGGADSVALLLALHESNGEVRHSLGIGLTAVHIQHGIRDASETQPELAFVQELCARLDTPLHIHHVNVPERAARNQETIEEAAREVRYEYFRSLIASGQADSVLTAHTLDDQAETVLMKILRGAWTQGLSGIHPIIEVESPKGQHGRILRPLLGIKRTDIETFLHKRKQSWRTDSTNADTRYTRNRIRHDLMPQLRSYNPMIDQALANMAELARDEEARWQGELARLLPHVLLPGKPVRGGGRSVSTLPNRKGIAIELERLRGFDPALRRRVLRSAALHLGFQLSFDDTTRLLALAGFSQLATVAARTGASVHLASGLRAERTARELQIHIF